MLGWVGSGGEPGPGMAGAGNDVTAGNAIRACVAGSAGKRLAGMAAVGADAAAGRDGGGAEAFAESGKWRPRISVDSRHRAMIREFWSRRQHEAREDQPISEQPMVADNQAMKALCFWVYERFGAG